MEPGLRGSERARRAAGRGTRPEAIWTLRGAFRARRYLCGLLVLDVEADGRRYGGNQGGQGRGGRPGAHAVTHGLVLGSRAGVSQNTLSKTIDDERVYTSGRYWLGISKSFVKFPLTLQSIEYSTDPGADGPPLGTQSAEGRVTIECSLQYRLQVEHLVDIYRKYETSVRAHLLWGGGGRRAGRGSRAGRGGGAWRVQYADKFVRTVQSAILNRAGEVSTAAEFYQDRRTLQNAFFEAARDALETEHATVLAFQLRKVQLPDELENQIIQSLRSQEAENTVERIRQQELLVANITLIQEETAAEVAVIRSNKTFGATVALAEAAADATRTVFEARSSAYDTLAQDVGLSNADIARRRFYTDLISKGGQRSKLLVGFESGSTVGA